MILYIIFGVLFCVYQADVLVYTAIACIAIISNYFWPEPGSPRYAYKYPSALIAPLDLTKDDQALTKSTAQNANGGQTHKPRNSMSSRSSGDWAITTGKGGPSIQGLASSSIASSDKSFSSSSSHSLGAVCADPIPGATTQATLQSVPSNGAEEAEQQLPVSINLPNNGQPGTPRTPGHPSGYNLRIRHSGTESRVSDSAATNMQGGTTAPHTPSMRAKDSLQAFAAANLGKRVMAATKDTQISQPCGSSLDNGTALLPESLVKQYDQYPLVLVQLPMYNEEAHCEVVIERACHMAWPRDRVIIQVGTNLWSWNNREQWYNINSRSGTTQQQ